MSLMNDSVLLNDSVEMRPKRGPHHARPMPRPEVNFDLEWEGRFPNPTRAIAIRAGWLGWVRLHKDWMVGALVGVLAVIVLIAFVWVVWYVLKLRQDVRELHDII